jgi:hypothetical protein
MPRVSTQQICFNRASGQARFQKVTYISREGVFSIGYPKEVVELLGPPAAATGTDLAKVNQAFKARLEAYENARTSAEKVILYEFCYETGGGAIGSHHGISFARGLAMSLAAAVFTETKVSNADGTAHFSYHHERSEIPWSLHNSHHNHSLGQTYGKQISNRLVWTPERELFFVKFAAAFVGLIDKMKDLTKSPEDLQLFIASNVPLLPAPPQERDPDDE